jgi:hypothetical protein
MGADQIQECQRQLFLYRSPVETHSAHPWGWEREMTPAERGVGGWVVKSTRWLMNNKIITPRTNNDRWLTAGLDMTITDQGQYPGVDAKFFLQGCRYPRAYFSMILCMNMKKSALNYRQSCVKQYDIDSCIRTQTKLTFWLLEMFFIKEQWGLKSEVSLSTSGLIRRQKQTPDRSIDRRLWLWPRSSLVLISALSWQCLKLTKQHWVCEG